MGRVRQANRTSSSGPELQVSDTLLLFAFALALRLAHVLAMRHSPYFDHPLVDAFTFHQDAKSIASGGGHPDRIFWQPPGYPYFLGLIYWAVGGVNFLAPRVAQAVLGALAVVLTAWIGARQLGRSVGLAAGSTVALYGTLIYFDGELLSVSLTVALQLGAVALALLASGAERSRLLWLAAGAVAGLASLVTATSLVFVAVLAVFARRLAPWCLIGAMLAIAPATIRNFVRGGELIPISSNGGVNLYIGNNPRYDEVVAVRPDARWKDLTAEPVRHGISSKAGASNYFAGKVTEWARQDPVAFLRLQLRKVRLLVGGDEIFRNQAIYPARAYSPVLSVLLWKVPGVAFPFGVLVPLSLLGLAVAWKRAPLLAWIVAIYALANVAFFITAQYRVPMVPYLAIFAALGVRWFLGETRRSARAVAMAGVLGLYALSNLGAGPMPARMNADAELTLAGFLHLEGRLEEARRHYLLSIEERRDDPEPWADLGALETDSRHPDSAERAFQEALAIKPEYVGALLGLGALRESEGRPEEAIAFYRRASLADPNDAWPRARVLELSRRLGIRAESR
ncbi:MAG: tetratricopeptide repeat protein [Candidatus Eisenbacteria bacterium]|uniref:Tetratricopeptide repeat protein n=1 Tax=Eiseniibacteriota bacterium TaxID=2212470 RepID=A0A538TMQ7_UNCEI|nr:MAG: tetratricopeptide repeat protein [Candidatus Eisenbacteria bacterium]